MNSSILPPAAPLEDTEHEDSLMSESQRDRAYRELRRVLLLQQIREGTRMREPEWSERLGVNRVALREAFARLEAEGFLEKGPKTGYFVPELSTEDVAEILEMRAVLECHAATRLCSSGPPPLEVVATLNQCCDELETLINGGYMLAVSEADRRFHETIIQLAGNRRLAKLYGNAPLPMLHGRLTPGDGWERECRATLLEHRAITRAIGAGNLKRAHSLLRAHLHGPYLQHILPDGLETS